MPEVDIDDSTIGGGWESDWSFIWAVIWWRFFVAMALLHLKAGLPVNIV